MPYYISPEQREVPIWRQCRHCRQPIVRGLLVGAGDKVTSRWWWGLKAYDDDSEVLVFCPSALNVNGEEAAKHQPFDVPATMDPEVVETWLGGLDA